MKTNLRRRRTRQGGPDRRRRRRDRRRDRPPLRPRGLRRLRHPTQRRQAASRWSQAHPRRGRRGARLRLGCAQGRAGRPSSSRPIEREIAPIEVVVFNIGANVRFTITETTERVYRKVWEMALLAGFLIGREAARGACCRAAAARSCSPAPRRPARAAVSPPSPAPSTRCARWRRAWRASSGRRASTSRMSSSTAPSTPQFIRENFPQRYALKDAATASWTPDAHRRRLLAAAPPAAQRLDARARPAAVDRDLVSRNGSDYDAATRPSRVLLRLRQPDLLPGVDAAARASAPRQRRTARLSADAARRRLQGHRQRVSPVTVPAKGQLDATGHGALRASATACRCSSTRTSRSTRWLLMRGAVGVQMRHAGALRDLRRRRVPRDVGRGAEHGRPGRRSPRCSQRGGFDRERSWRSRGPGRSRKH